MATRNLSFSRYCCIKLLRFCLDHVNYSFYKSLNGTSHTVRAIMNFVVHNETIKVKLCCMRLQQQKRAHWLYALYLFTLEVLLRCNRWSIGCGTKVKVLMMRMFSILLHSAAMMMMIKCNCRATSLSHKLHIRGFFMTSGYFRMQIMNFKWQITS